MNDIVITKIIDAPREKVWEAWTTPELVEKWWGPEGFTAPSAKIDLKEGGKYVYAMKGPDGTEWDRVMYSAGVFNKIIPYERIELTDFFSDQEGNKMSPSEFGMPENTPDEMKSVITFEEVEDGKTKLTITYLKPENEAQFEAMLKSGMKEGWKSSLNKFEEVLK